MSARRRAPPDAVLPEDSSTSGRRDNRLPPARRRGAGDRLPRRLPLRHDRHQGVVSRGLLPPARARLRALRLFRAWRVERRFRRGHDRPLARGRGRGHRFADRAGRRSWSARAWAAGSCCWRRWPGPSASTRWSASPRAPDFTEELLWPRLDPAQRARSCERGAVDAALRLRPGRLYLYAAALIEDGRRHLLLRAPIAARHAGAAAARDATTPRCRGSTACASPSASPAAMSRDPGQGRRPPPVDRDRPRPPRARSTSCSGIDRILVRPSSFSTKPLPPSMPALYNKFGYL